MAHFLKTTVCRIRGCSSKRKLAVSCNLKLKGGEGIQSSFSSSFFCILQEKQHENEAAMRLLVSQVDRLAALPMPERLLQIVKNILAGNVFDWGAQAVVKYVLLSFMQTPTLCVLHMSVWAVKPAGLHTCAHTRARARTCTRTCTRTERSDATMCHFMCVALLMLRIC